MKIKNPEDYYSNFKLNKTLSLPQIKMYYLDFIKKFPKSGYPDSAYLKVIKNKSKEISFHQQISSIIPDYSLKIHHTIEYDSTTEVFIETTENGQLSQELDNFQKFPPHYISKAIYQLSFALKLLHQNHIYLGNINASNLFISSFLKFANFEKAGECFDDKAKIPAEIRTQVKGGYIPGGEVAQIDHIDEKRIIYDRLLEGHKQIIPKIADIRQYDVFCLGFIFLQFFIGKIDLNVENDSIKINQLLNDNKDKITIRVIKNVLSKMLELPPEITMKEVVNNISLKHNYLERRRFGPMCFYCFEENIVNDERGDNEIKNYLCPHFFHNGCMRAYLQYSLKKIESLEELKCKFCNQAFPYELNQIIQKFDLESRLKSEKLFYRTQDFICPEGHECPSQKMLSPKLKPYKVSCPECRRTYCSFCGEVHYWLNFNRCQNFKDLEINLRNNLK